MAADECCAKKKECKVFSRHLVICCENADKGSMEKAGNVTEDLLIKLLETKEETLKARREIIYVKVLQVAKLFRLESEIVQLIQK